MELEAGLKSHWHDFWNSLLSSFGFVSVGVLVTIFPPVAIVIIVVVCLVGALLPIDNAVGLFRQIQQHRLILRKIQTRIAPDSTKKIEAGKRGKVTVSRWDQIDQD